MMQEMVRLECERWARKGINITYQIREDRKGYKAGALRAGMKHAYVRECEYVVIFDADFQPDPDFLKRTIPYLVHNPEIALVQARWRFGQYLYTDLINLPSTMHFCSSLALLQLYYYSNTLFSVDGGKLGTAVNNAGLGCV
jgi:beta-mannan synthase